MITLFVGCAGERVAPEEGKPSEAASPSRARSLANEFQWAVQDYEAGKYVAATEKFQKLEAAGAENPEFDLVPFYLGMGYFQAGQDGPAKERLQTYLKGERSGENAQEARLALLTIYERTHAWDELLGLSAETDPQPLSQTNRAYLKLLWARALKEKREAKGARAVLAESLQYLRGDPSVSAKAATANQDLWGRYHYTDLLLRLDSCERSSPRTLAEGKKGARRIYPAWLDSSVDCYRAALRFMESELLNRESAWAKPGAEDFSKAVDVFAQRIQGFYQDEKNQLNRRRALQSAARASVYRFLSALEESTRALKPGVAGPEAFANIRKRLDLLLVSISSPT
ncbi:MAG: hypothetical protein EOP11_12500 [Proteobacteria bacterium]|nr:MAG: hypothetical protein EOP11_12500 [Pseudomonadota bacterium]